MRVQFTAPASARDLRVVLASHTARNHDTFAVAYRTAFGEARIINWLTEFEAHRRAAALKLRGYTVIVGAMDHAA